MRKNINWFVVLIITTFFFLYFQPPLVYAEVKKKEVQDVTIQVTLHFAQVRVGELATPMEVLIEIKKVDPTVYEPEEAARLLSHWFSKMLYLFDSPYGSPLPKIFLFQEVELSLFETPLKSQDSVFKKTQIDDVVKIVDNLDENRIASSIELYLQKFKGDSSYRGIISFCSEDLTEQQSVFSWAVILQYVSHNFSQKDIDFVTRIMEETVKQYSAGADEGDMENMVVIPNYAFFKVKGLAR